MVPPCALPIGEKNIPTPTKAGIWLPGGVLAGRPNRADDVLDPHDAAWDAAQAAILASQGVPRDLYDHNYRPLYNRGAEYGPSPMVAARAEAVGRRYGGATMPAAMAAADARRSEPVGLPVSLPNVQNPPYHAFDDTPADAPQSEPSQEEQPSYNSVADTILGAASSLSDAELRSVVARMRAMCARRSIAMSAEDTTPTSDGMGT
jgi:hypothetical protein